jgi:tetratricopeptide (TPR) repeat protein
MIIARRVLPVLGLLAALLAAVLVYLPGIDGPFLFDDRPNITRNPMVKMDALGLTSLADAFFSGSHASARRGLARVSFALNHYAAGGFDARAFKLTNVAIHLLNGVLVFFLAAALLRSPALCARAGSGGDAEVPREWRSVIALLAAAIWLLHPIQLTSVLYVVQRMTSLAALCVFAGLLLYVLGRLRVLHARRGGFTMMALGLVGGVGLGVLCKENAVLLPVLAFVVELVLFGWPPPDSPQRASLLRFHALFILVPFMLALIAMVYLWPRWLEDYASVRDFTMTERLLTQSRVMWLYLGLFFAPLLHRFSLFHDDLALSTGLFEPASTALAICALALVIVYALHCARRGHVWAFAALFFLAGHAMESSFIALEMVHEHRNYVPAFALSVALAWYLVRGVRALARPRLFASITAVAIFAALGMVTATRASIWSDESVLARHIVAHHPGSYRAQSQLARMLAAEQATAHDLFMAYRASAYANRLAVYPLIRMQRIVTSLLTHVQAGVFIGTLPVPAEALRDARWDPDVIYLDVRFLRTVSHALNAAIDTRLRKAVLWVETLAELDQVHVCLRNSGECVGLLDDALAWTATALEHSRMGDRGRSELLILRGRFLALDGRMDEAIELARQAAALAPDNLIPPLNEVVLLGRAGRFDEAEALLTQLRALEVPGRSRRGVMEAERLLRMMLEQGTEVVDPSPAAEVDIDPGPPLPVFPAPAR